MHASQLWVGFRLPAVVEERFISGGKRPHRARIAHVSSVTAMFPAD
jgi:hypothetical protein